MCFVFFLEKKWHIACQYNSVIKNIIMKINNTSLCSTCIHAISCSLTSNKNAIWSCSEYEEQVLKNNNPKTILIPSFNFTNSEKEMEII